MAQFVKLETSMGTALYVFMSPFSLTLFIGSLVLELYTSHAPKTCRNFYELAKIGYYNDTTFHRVIKGSSSYV
jgi:hypothetical protein